VCVCVCVMMCWYVVLQLMGCKSSFGLIPNVMKIHLIENKVAAATTMYCPRHSVPTLDAHCLIALGLAQRYVPQLIEYTSFTSPGHADGIFNCCDWSWNIGTSFDGCLVKMPNWKNVDDGFKILLMAPANPAYTRGRSPDSAPYAKWIGWVHIEQHWHSSE